MYYHDHYTWQGIYDDQVVIHSDGAVSTYLEWDGIDVDLDTQEVVAAKWQKLYNVLTKLDAKTITEFHFWREYDNSATHRYLKHSDKIIRGGEFAHMIRTELADHLGRQGMSNQLGIVLIKQSDHKIHFTAKSQLKHEGLSAERLLISAGELVESLKAEIKPVDKYFYRIQQSFDRRRHLMGSIINMDHALSVNEQFITEAPQIENRVLKIENEYTKVLLLFQYPDADPAWMLPILSVRCAMHIMVSVKPADTKESLAAAESSGRRAEATLDTKGQDFQRQKIAESQDYREWIRTTKGVVVKNFMVIHLHSSNRKQLEEANRAIVRYIETQGGQVRDADYIQRFFFRVGQPGQSYLSTLYRPDGHALVANMLPVQKWSSGDIDNPDILQLEKSGQLITSSVMNKALNHSFFGGMTRSGKDAFHVSQVAQLYPLGANYYFLEIGSTNKWLCQAFGGEEAYLTIDPEHTVINPLPPYAIVNIGAEFPVNIDICTETIRAIMFILTGFRNDMENHPEWIHELAAAQNVLQSLYRTAPQGTKLAPTMVDYLNGLNKYKNDSKEQNSAAKRLAANLDSFLTTGEGKIFAREDNTNIHGGIFGVDLKDVRSASEQLTIFYVVFIALRMTQLAFSSRQYTQIVLNELHELVRISPKIIGNLCSSIARMGAKEKSFLTILTQDTDEVEKLDSGILSQMSRQALLYRRDKWEIVGKKLNVPEGVVNRWKTIPYPVDLPYRECIYGHGDTYHHYHVTLPSTILNLADSSPDVLDAKDRIEKITADPFERLKLLEEFRRKSA